MLVATVSHTLQKWRPLRARPTNRWLLPGLTGAQDIRQMLLFRVQEIQQAPVPHEATAYALSHFRASLDPEVCYADY